MMKFVEKLLAVRPYRLTLRFNTGEVRVVDLETTLRAKALSPQSAYSRLLDPATFSLARLDPESRTVCGDGLAREATADGTERAAPLDFCPDSLYGMSTPLPQNAPDSALALKDEPPQRT
jgi:hypothetical protein